MAKTFRVAITDYCEAEGSYFHQTIEVCAGRIKGGVLPSVIIKGREFAVYSNGLLSGSRKLVVSGVTGCGAIVHPADLAALKTASAAIGAL